MMRAAAKRLVLEVVGWTLVVVGIAALVLPGPGLLTIVAGLIILSQQYEWAERRLEPLKEKAIRGAAEGVETWPRIIMSSVFAVGLVACGVLWVVGPPVPSWWPSYDQWWLPDERWWLPGGIATGVTQIASGLFALGLIVYSFRRFRGGPRD